MSQSPSADDAGSPAGRAAGTASATRRCSTAARSAASGDAVVHYRKEIIRLIAEMGLGAGALAIIGGTVAIVGFLTLATGALVAVQGYSHSGQHRRRGPDRFLSAFINVRIIAPADRRHRLWPPPSAPAPPRSSARCGSTRRSTRWRSMGIRSIAYLASTRIMAGMIVVIPLYCVAVMMSFLAAQFGTTVHLRPVDAASTTTTSGRSSTRST